MLAWLKKYKIIFETLVAASLTVMGVLVSVAAVFVTVSQNKLISKQYELERYGAEPVFTVEWEESENNYVVRNIGAEIHDVTCTIKTWFAVEVVHESPESLLLCRDNIAVIMHEVEGGVRPLFFEVSQSFMISRALFEPFFPEEEVYSMIKESYGLDSDPWYPQKFCCAEISYKNYLNEQHKKSLLITCYAHLGYESFSVKHPAPEEDKYDLTILINQYNALETFKEKLDAYLSEHLLPKEATP